MRAHLCARGLQVASQAAGAGRHHQVCLLAVAVCHAVRGGSPDEQVGAAAGHHPLLERGQAPAAPAAAAKHCGAAAAQGGDHHQLADAVGILQQRLQH